MSSERGAMIGLASLTAANQHASFSQPMIQNFLNQKSSRTFYEQRIQLKSLLQKFIL